jgi:hypothetical protein
MTQFTIASIRISENYTAWNVLADDDSQTYALDHGCF